MKLSHKALYIATRQSSQICELYSLTNAVAELHPAAPTLGADGTLDAVGRRSLDHVPGARLEAVLVAAGLPSSLTGAPRRPLVNCAIH